MTHDFVDRIFADFARRGGERYGESVTLLEHSLQCAELAIRDGADPALATAALLHDYGHVMDDRGDLAQEQGVDAQHEMHGSAALAPWFGPDVRAPIALHVAAKRYLCAMDRAYEATLSPASILSLELQGGRFTPAQCQTFEKTRGFAHAVQLRRYDDLAKVSGAPTPSLEDFRPVMLAAAKT